MNYMMSEYDQRATNMTMWEKHTCRGTPTHRCAACWAAAYDNDPSVLEANLRKLGYYDERTT